MRIGSRIDWISIFVYGTRGIYLLEYLRMFNKAVKLQLFFNYKSLTMFNISSAIRMSIFKIAPTAVIKRLSRRFNRIAILVDRTGEIYFLVLFIFTDRSFWRIVCFKRTSFALTVHFKTSNRPLSPDRNKPKELILISPYSDPFQYRIINNRCFQTDDLLS